MALSNAEFEAILADTSKCIDANIVWQEDEDHSPCVGFRAEVSSEAGWPLFVKGSYNCLIGALSYVMILQTDGRIYGLDLGKDHHNPQCDQIGRIHKHRWTEKFRDKEAYRPEDITRPANDPVGVWSEFCAEAGLRHNGVMNVPSFNQGDLFE